MTRIQHTVVFRLVHPQGSDAETEFLATARRTLPAIPGVGDFVISRQVSPKSDLAWQFSMIFADDAAYAAYNAHPAHTDFVETRWAREVQVFQEYDFMVDQGLAGPARAARRADARLGVDAAVLHDRALPEAGDVVELGRDRCGGGRP